MGSILIFVAVVALLPYLPSASVSSTKREMEREESEGPITSYIRNRTKVPRTHLGKIKGFEMSFCRTVPVHLRTPPPYLIGAPYCTIPYVPYGLRPSTQAVLLQVLEMIFFGITYSKFPTHAYYVVHHGTAPDRTIQQDALWVMYRKLKDRLRPTVSSERMPPCW